MWHSVRTLCFPVELGSSQNKDQQSLSLSLPWKHRIVPVQVRKLTGAEWAGRQMSVSLCVRKVAFFRAVHPSKPLGSHFRSSEVICKPSRDRISPLSADPKARDFYTSCFLCYTGFHPKFPRIFPFAGFPEPDSAETCFMPLFDF